MRDVAFVRKFEEFRSVLLPEIGQVVNKEAQQLRHEEYKQKLSHLFDVPRTSYHRR
jgi:hypothetical protein